MVFEYPIYLAEKISIVTDFFDDVPFGKKYNIDINKYNNEVNTGDATV